MVSLKQTSLKYRGKKAETYDDIRVKQARWGTENEAIGGWITSLKPRSVLDCPVGTGRFFPYYTEASVPVVHGVDISEEMLALAKRKVPAKMKKSCDLKLIAGSATQIDAKDKTYDMVVCARFLDLIDEEAMQAVTKELTRVAKRFFVCTIRFGEKYVPKSNTSEHDKKKFMAMIARLGWKVRESKNFRSGSWHILLLERK